MLNKNGMTPQSRVSALNAGVVEPNPQRVAALKQWHIDQAISDKKPVAIINFTLTADGEIYTKAIGLEPEHAKVMLPALEEAVQQLRHQVGYGGGPKSENDYPSNLQKRKLDLLNTHGPFCQHCDKAFPPNELQVRTSNYHSSTSNMIYRTLSCRPCLPKEKFAEAIPPVPRFNIV